jgi:hypothetical protein
MQLRRQQLSLHPNSDSMFNICIQSKHRPLARDAAFVESFQSVFAYDCVKHHSKL